MNLTLEPLPRYSSDLNPIEGLWKWIREEVTWSYGHKTLEGLRQCCEDFIKRIDENPRAVVHRLWPRFELDPEYEKLLNST